jgi:WD40 repeat protein
MKPPTVTRGHGGDVRAVLFTPDGVTPAFAGMDEALKLWMVPPREWVWTVEGHEKRVNTLAVGTDSAMLLPSVENRAQLEKVRVKAKGVYGPGFSAEGRWLALAAAD